MTMAHGDDGHSIWLEDDKHIAMFDVPAPHSHAVFFSYLFVLLPFIISSSSCNKTDTIKLYTEHAPYKQAVSDIHVLLIVWR